MQTCRKLQAPLVWLFKRLVPFWRALPRIQTSAHRYLMRPRWVLIRCRKPDRQTLAIWPNRWARQKCQRRQKMRKPHMFFTGLMGPSG